MMKLRKSTDFASDTQSKNASTVDSKSRTARQQKYQPYYSLQSNEQLKYLKDGRDRERCFSRED